MVSRVACKYLDVRFVGTPELPEWVANDVVSVLYPQADQRNYMNYLAKVQGS